MEAPDQCQASSTEYALRSSSSSSSSSLLLPLSSFYFVFYSFEHTKENNAKNSWAFDLEDSNYIESMGNLLLQKELLRSNYVGTMSSHKTDHHLRAPNMFYNFMFASLMLDSSCYMCPIPLVWRATQTLQPHGWLLCGGYVPCVGEIICTGNRVLSSLKRSALWVLLWFHRYSFTTPIAKESV